MNIFVLDKYPASAVRMLCDCHVRKMSVETAQILSGVMIRRGLPLRDGMPKPQNINHPVIVAATNGGAANWVLNYYFELLDEYKYRFGREHRYERFKFNYKQKLWAMPLEAKHHWLCKCCGNLDVSDLDIVVAYRMYYAEVKKPQLIAKDLWKFTNREDWT